MKNELESVLWGRGGCGCGAHREEGVGEGRQRC